MNGKKLIEEMLDLLVKMTEHCNNIKSDKPNVAKCKNCAMSRYYTYKNSGCLLVDIYNNDEFMNSLEYTCKYQDVKYMDKLNKVAEIFVTECEE